MDPGARVPRAKRFTSRTVEILVGKETFHIHEDVLKSRSTFFSAALHKTWKEGTSGKIELPDDNPEAVGVYFNWLYFSTIACETPNKTRAEVEDEEISKELWLLIRAYVFGEKITDGAFCNTVMSALLRCVDEEDSAGSHHFPGAEKVRLAYEGTPQGSPLRAFLVEMYTKYGLVEWMEGEDWNAEFVFDIMKCFMAKREQPPHENTYDEREKWFKKVD